MKEEGFAGDSSANLAFEHRTDYPEPYDKETRQAAADYFSLSRGHRKLVRDLIKALNARAQSMVARFREPMPAL